MSGGQQKRATSIIDDPTCDGKASPASGSRLTASSCRAGTRSEQVQSRITCGNGPARPQNHQLVCPDGELRALGRRGLGLRGPPRNTQNTKIGTRPARAKHLLLPDHDTWHPCVGWAPVWLPAPKQDQARRTQPAARPQNLQLVCPDELRALGL